MLTLRFPSFALTAALLFCGGARADEAAAPSATAESLFWEGRRAADAGDLATACSRFAESLALERLAGTAFNLAHCEDRRGLVASAWRHYREAAERMKSGDERLAIAEGRAAALSPRLPKLLFRVADPPPPGLAVSLDGLAIQTAELSAPRPVDPGEHVVRVTAEGRPPREIKVNVNEAQEEEVLLAPGPAAPVAPLATPPPPTPSAREEAPSDRASEGRRIVGLSLLGAGGGGLVFGAIAGGMALYEKGQFDERCPNAICSDRSGFDIANRGSTWGTTSNVALAAGVSLAAVGLILLLYHPSEKPATKASSAPRWIPRAPDRITW